MWGAKPPTEGATEGGCGGVAPHVRRGDWGAKPHSLEITHFVTFSVMFFVVFVAFHPLFTPPKTPFSQQIPLACWLVIRGFIVILGKYLRKFVAF